MLPLPVQLCWMALPQWLPQHPQRHCWAPEPPTSAPMMCSSYPALLCPMLQWTGPPGHPSISLVTTLANSDSSDAQIHATPAPSLFLRHHHPPRCPGHTLERPPPRIPSAPALGGTAVHPPDTACPISHPHVPGRPRPPPARSCCL
uniref:Uncharacterized protein n=1 Tax=Mustela putorius furo TaxID=9669 RepID=M3Y6N5_MUSPF